MRLQSSRIGEAFEGLRDTPQPTLLERLATKAVRKVQGLGTFDEVNQVFAATTLSVFLD